MTENGVIRVRSGRYMDRLNRAGLNFNLAGSVGPETDYFFTLGGPLNFNRRRGPVRLPENEFFKI